MDKLGQKLEITEQYLDKIDIKYISKTFHLTDLYKLMHKIEDDVIKGEIDELEGGIFNYMGSAEFMDYLQRRYSKDELTCMEVVRYELMFK